MDANGDANGGRCEALSSLSVIVARYRQPSARFYTLSTIPKDPNLLSLLQNLGNGVIFAKFRMRFGTECSHPLRDPRRDLRPFLSTLRLDPRPCLPASLEGSSSEVCVTS